MSTPNIGTYAISDLDQEFEAMFHGTSLNQIQNKYGAYNRGARRLLGDIDPQETTVVSQFGKLYDGVFDYPVAVDLKGNKIIDLFPQANRLPSDRFGQTYNQSFDRFKNVSLVPDFSTLYNSAFRSIRINATGLNTGIQINAADGYNTNGTWVAGTNVSNVGTNNQFYTNNASGSVSFQLNQTGVAASVATISNSTMSAVDLTNHYNNADEFFNLYLPNAAGISSVTFRIGTNATNYYQSPVLTTDQMNNTFGNGWNFLKSALSGFTQTGTPTLTQIQYVQVSITYNGTLQTQVLLNQFYSRLGVIYNQEYYSKYLFRDAITGVFKEKVTSDTDIVNLDTDGINMLLYAVFGEMVQQVQGADALYYDANDAEQNYVAGVAGYKLKYRSQTQKPQTSYYRQPRASYRRYIQRGGFNQG